MACDRVQTFFPLVQDGSLTPDSIHHEGRFRSWRNMEPYRLYLIIYIHGICITESTWFLIHIWEDPSDIDTDVYVYFPSDDMFTTNSEFAPNQRHMIAHLLYDGERVLIVGPCCRHTYSLQMDRQNPSSESI